MTKHGKYLHKHCDHCRHCCEDCNITYCCKCDKEWRGYGIPWKHPKFPWEDPYKPWLQDLIDADQAGIRAGIELCAHSHE